MIPFPAGHCSPVPTTSNRPASVPEAAAHWRLARHLPRHHAHVYGDDAVAVHHLSADVRGGGEGEEDQGEHEDHGAEGFSLLVSEEAFASIAHEDNAYRH